MNMANSCALCQGRLLSHSYVIKCTVCSGHYHRTCLPLISKSEFVLLKRSGYWSCCACNSEIFPFNHNDDNDDFINAISENWCLNDIYSLSDLEKRLFSPFEIDQVNEDISNDDLDPDLNFFNDLHILSGSSKYFDDKSLNKTISDSKLTSLDPLSFLTLNIRSIPKNIDKLSSYISLFDISFSFVGITETWFTDDNIDSYSLDNYNHEAVHRSSRRGGGVSLFTKNNIPYTLRPDLNIFDSYAETLFIEVDKNVFSTDKNLIVGVLYRIPNTDMKCFNDMYNETLNKIKNESKLSYLLGDYNINLLNTDSHAPTNDFVDICFSNGFLPLINKPTRVTKYSATIIDNIITNDIVNVSHIQGLLLADISDHFPIFIIHKNIKESNPDITFQKRVITYKSLSAFRTALEQHSFQSITSLGDINDASSLFCSELRSMYEKHFPLKSFKRKYS